MTPWSAEPLRFVVGWYRALIVGVFALMAALTIPLAFRARDPGSLVPLHRHDHDYLSIAIEGERIVHNPEKEGHCSRMEVDVSSPGSVLHLRGGATEGRSTQAPFGSARSSSSLLDDPR